MAMSPFTVWEQGCFFEKEKMVYKKTVTNIHILMSYIETLLLKKKLELRASVNIECKINGVLKIVNVPLLFKG